MKPHEHTTPLPAKKQPPKKPPQGVVSDLESYSIAEFMRRMSIGRKLWRKMVAEGFVVREVGKRRFVLGTDWHEFLRREK